jgi:hypothetical protein
VFYFCVLYSNSVANINNLYSESQAGYREVFIGPLVADPFCFAKDEKSKASLMMAEALEKQIPRIVLPDAVAQKDRRDFLI